MPGYTRRQLKEDKFADTAQGAALWATGHRQTVILTVGLVIVAVLATAGVMTWRGHQTEQANTELSAAMRTFETPIGPAAPAGGDAAPTFPTITDRAKAAEKQFGAVADKYSSVSPGRISRYMRGIALLQAGDKAGAEQELKTAANFSDKDVAALAKMALAAMDRGANRTSDAIAIYKELADHPTATVPKSQAQLELADIYETTDPQQAMLIYQQLQKDGPNSPAAQVASQKLAKGK
ncbi:MAG TPA: tetratricopeptide repeat protein [Candidatus Angelobacter sp.]|nr:tetratricopeptide repeat protein [Candidatus Angelobacter sp.]